MKVNHIYNENNLVTMARMPDNFIDLTVTSPPYDNLRTYNGFSLDFENVAKELFRVTKEGGTVVWNVSDETINGSETGTSFRQALFFMECGFKLHDTMLYAKANPMPAPGSKRYASEFEYVFILTKGTIKTFNPITEQAKYAGKRSTGTRYDRNGTLQQKTATVIADKKIRSNIWYYNVGGEGTGHPAIFPVQFAADHIYTWSNEGDLVYDPFMGSGTTAIAAHKLKRRWLGSDISQKYVALSFKRLEPYLTQTTLF